MSLHNSKKRPAPSQVGPTPKKINIQKSHTGKGKKRSMPVTADVEEQLSDSEDDDDDDDEPYFDQGAEAEDDPAAEPNGDDEMDVDVDQTETLSSTKDPNANHESHVAQRALLASRRAAKPHSALLSEAKRIWAEARQKDMERRKQGTGAGVKRSADRGERRARVTELMDLVRGKVADLVLKHDASRIIQTIVKYGLPAERLEVAKELEGNCLTLVQGKYSKVRTMTIIHPHPPSRSIIILELAPSVPRLLHHAYATSVLADAYEIHCTGSERAQLLRAFWGREAALFGDGIGVGVGGKNKKRNKDGGGGLKAVLEASDDIERRKRTLTSVKENLLGIFNNPSPIAARHAITHRALWEYLEALGSTDLFPEDKFSEQDRERGWRDIFDSCQEQLAEMIHTRDGSRSVREFLARGTAKDRKQIVKVLKPHIARIAQSDEAQLVLFTALDVIDDTKLTAKQLIAELLPSPPTSTTPSTLLTSAAGRRTLLYTIIPRSLRHFTPAIVHALAETDALRAKTSKKDEAVRRDEVRAAASPGLLALVEERGVEMSRDPKGSLVVAEIILFTEGDNSPALKTLSTPLSLPYPSPSPSTPHPIDIPHTSRLYKTLLQGGHYNMSSKSIEPSSHYDPGAFATMFVSTVGREGALEMATGGGAFVLAELCERLKGGDGDEAVHALRGKVKEWFGESEMRRVEASEAKGKNVLLEKLRALGG
ncbi:armadillo-type protein [Hysterangium stoloniferum]|nr:armadillo-type protein [Hysterangium stoloniferum]